MEGIQWIGHQKDTTDRSVVATVREHVPPFQGLGVLGWFPGVALRFTPGYRLSPLCG